MIHSSLRRYWIGHIRLALTLFGLPSAASCALNNHFRDYQFSSTLRYHYYSTGEPVMTSSGVLHVKSRCPQYPGSQVKRCPVPDDKVEWSQNWPEYSPVSHTDPAVTKKPKWADPEIGASYLSVQIIYRLSTKNKYSNSCLTIYISFFRNPRGRTGVTGRGLLGRWGPNHAADPIVTRWKMDKKGAKMPHAVSKRPILQFVSIKRKDCGEWAIPGGMVDPGEQISLTLQREFSEEALNSLAMSASDKTKLHARITNLFKSPGIEVYKGYVDDPRNTDNAWMETVAVNFHDESGDSVSELPLQAGDDAGQVQWVDVDSSFPLYASHSSFLERVAKERSAHW
uniref:ADP-ribose pyrophosphatase, mitochondrial n=1 Tax=Periophthalmus magnuspinnatus TaxID=409849 RepID=A0A3B4AVP1_9GOBI